ncbi:leucyl aminopeptidase [Anaerobaca lacustris]|uniref:Probable cytosol aminopeptidase n=1 Tax=Anaerobaca lacustris TaxID=3044600 RepID=A0AAW6TSQ6_9BACT|nr:leucyl aminopeptidase [Sedimentisphaerales bacterium M17dextr]
MKQIIAVDIKTRKVEPARCKTDMLVVGRFSDGVSLDKVGKALDEKLGGAIARLAKLGDFVGKAGTSAIVYGDGKLPAQRVMLIGLGEPKKATLDTIRKAAATAANQAVNMKIQTLSLALHQAAQGKFDTVGMGKAMAEGAYFGSYRYDEFITESQNGRRNALKVEVVDAEAGSIKTLNKGLAAGAVIGRAQSYARTIANRPGNVITPSTLARAAVEMARGTKGLQCTVFDARHLKTKRMGGILAVGAGSKNEPRLIILKYTPAKTPAKGSPRVALVGKAVTFDSGGISIKPSADMDQMKLDKSGGIAVLAAMKAVAELGLPVNVWGLIPSAENLPSGSSYRPGDIVTTYSGKTVEILNTDAEGRMILCDALAYAAKQKFETIIDIATLTGACMVALGQYKAGLMSNDDDLIEMLRKASEDSGENVWHLPSGDEYADEMKSKIADLRNTGGRWGGACTAAAFLRQFVGETKWAHLDIAGMDILQKGTDYAAPGSTGFGVRLLVTYLMNLTT